MTNDLTHYSDIPFVASVGPTYIYEIITNSRAPGNIDNIIYMTSV